MLIVLGTLSCTGNTASSTQEGSSPSEQILATGGSSNADDRSTGDGKGPADPADPNNPATTIHIQATLVRTIDTSQLLPATTNPTDILYFPPLQALLISDGQDPDQPLLAGMTLFQLSLAGDLSATFRTTASAWFNTLSKAPPLLAPTGLAFNPDNGHLFISDNQAAKIFDMQPGTDEKFGTADDIITTFYNTVAFGSRNPQGIAYDSQQQTLYIADEQTGTVFQLAPGPNAIFDAPAPKGDDQIVALDTAGLGIPRPTGVAFNPDRTTLFIVGRDTNLILEIMPDGTLIHAIDISLLNPRALAGVTYAPGQPNAVATNLYLLDQGDETDKGSSIRISRVFEISLTSLNAHPVNGASNAPFSGNGPAPSPDPFILIPVKNK